MEEDDEIQGRLYENQCITKANVSGVTIIFRW